MKIFGPKSLSVYLFYVTRLVSIGIGILLLFIILSFVIGNFNLNEGRFSIAIPLTGTFIKGDYKTNVIVTISLTLVYITTFFFLLSIIFKTFKSELLFTKIAIKQLSYFAILNLVVGPLLYTVIHFMIMQKSNFRDLPNLILSLLLGIFVLCVIAIFKQGFQLQSENELTI